MKLLKDFGVRALLGTIVVAGATYGALSLIIGGQDPVLGMGFLSAGAMGAIGFYFGQRQQGSTP